MNYKQMLETFETLKAQIKALEDQQSALELRLKTVEQHKVVFTPIPQPNFYQPPWQVTCQPNPQDAFK